MCSADATSKSDVLAAKQQRLSRSELARCLGVKVGIKGAAADLGHGWSSMTDTPLRARMKLSVDPFPDVSDQLSNAVGCAAGGRIGDRDGVTAAAGPGVGFGGSKALPQGYTDSWSPGVPLRPCPRSLPFFGGRQSFADPGGIGIGFVPADADHGMIQLVGRAGTPSGPELGPGRPVRQQTAHAGQDSSGQYWDCRSRPACTNFAYPRSSRSRDRGTMRSTVTRISSGSRQSRIRRRGDDDVV